MGKDSMKKLLILNGSHSDVPLIKAGKKLGYYVITSGNRPDLLGHKYADEYVNCDFSKPELVYETFKDFGLDAVCACSNDFGAISVAYLAEKLGLPGHDTYENALILHHKDKFKVFSKKNQIHTPIAEGFSTIDDAKNFEVNCTYPMIVKPIDLTGGKGVTRVENKDEYNKAVNYAFSMSPSKRIVVEPFIEGTHHSFSTFLVNKKVVAYYSDNEYELFNPFLVSTSAGPATDVDKVKDILISDAEKIADLLDLVDGVFHYQYILSTSGEPYILEITRRNSGDQYCVPVEHSTGIPWAEWIVRAECGMSCESFPVGSKQRIWGGRHCLQADKEGIIKEICISDEIKDNIYASFMWGGVGTSINNKLVDKVGILFLEYKSQEEMIDKTNRIKELVKVKI